MSRNPICPTGQTLLTLIILLCLAAGCRERPRRLAPFGWSATGGRSDSVLVRLDRTVQSYGDPDSIRTLAELYCRLSAQEDPEGTYLHRRLYQEGTALFMTGDFEKGDSLRRQALQTCDSARFPHDWRLYRLAIEQPADFPDNMARYHRYTSDLEAFMDEEDAVSAFSRAVLLSGLMSEAGLHGRALRYVTMADSLLERAGLPELRAANRVNLASCRFQCADTAGAVSILRTLLESPPPSGIGAPSVRAVINFNIYQMNGDTTALHKAWDMAMEDPSLDKLRPLAAAAIVHERIRRRETAGISRLRPLLEKGKEYSYPEADELYIAEAVYELSAATCAHVDTAAVGAYREAAGRYIRSLATGEVVAADTSARIREVELRERERSAERLRRIVLIVAAAMICGAFLIMRHMGRVRRRRLLQQLEIERLRRSNIASSLMIAEKERLMESLQRRLDILVQSDRLPQAEAGEIAAAFDTDHNPGTEGTSEEDFIRLFAAEYPDVGKAGRRLALLIRRGLDTSGIAEEMNIRKESVMQARWRLRNQMHLAAESDLDLTILTLTRHRATATGDPAAPQAGSGDNNR